MKTLSRSREKIYSERIFFLKKMVEISLFIKYSSPEWSIQPNTETHSGPKNKEGKIPVSSSFITPLPLSFIYFSKYQFISSDKTLRTKRPYCHPPPTIVIVGRRIATSGHRINPIAPLDHLVLLSWVSISLPSPLTPERRSPFDFLSLSTLASSSTTCRAPRSPTEAASHRIWAWPLISIVRALSRQAWWSSGVANNKERDRWRVARNRCPWMRAVVSNEEAETATGSTAVAVTTLTMLGWLS